MRTNERFDADGLFYMGIGPMAAVFLGAALIPLRESVLASNLTFVFLPLVIVVAEFGGRTAAVATAVASALSLDFFLTQPYLTLVIASKHDLIAVLGLGGCGLLVATLSQQRLHAAEAETAARRHLAALHVALAGLERGAPVESRLNEVLDACRMAFPLAGAVVRDPHGTVVATSDRGQATKAEPSLVLASDSLIPPGGPALHEDDALPLPAGGGRLPLVVGNRQVGWLDLWGDGSPASFATRRTLSDAARLMGALLACARPTGPQAR